MAPTDEKGGDSAQPPSQSQAATRRFEVNINENIYTNVSSDDDNEVEDGNATADHDGDGDDDDETNDPYTDISSMSDDGHNNNYIGDVTDATNGQHQYNILQPNLSLSFNRSDSNDGDESSLDLNLQSSSDNNNTNNNNNEQQNQNHHSQQQQNNNINAKHHDQDQTQNDDNAFTLQLSRSSLSSTSSIKNNLSGNNLLQSIEDTPESSGSGGGNNNKDTVLQCVVTTDQQTKQPSSPLGNVSIASTNGGGGGSSPSGNKQQFVVPRFYDSEEEGAGGSLVFVGSADNNSLSRGGQTTMMMSANVLSPKMNPNQGLFIRSSNSSEDGGGSLIRVPPKDGSGNSSNSNSNINNNDATAPELLPYQHRKQLSQKDIQQPPLVPVDTPGMQLSTTPTNQSQRPPLAFPPKSSSSQQQQQQQQLQQLQLQQLPQPPPMPSTAVIGGASPPQQVSKNKYKVAQIPKYKVAQIPPFKKGGANSPKKIGDSRSDSEASGAENVDEGGFKPMRKVKSTGGATATATTKSSRKNRKGNTNVNVSPEKEDRDGNNTKNRPPLPPVQQQQEVIDPTFNNNSNPPSPRSGGYHIRINSQSSMSSLGSNAGVDSDAPAGHNAVPLHHVGMQQKPHPNQQNSAYYHYEQQQQQQQQRGGRGQQQQQQQPSQPRPPSVNYNDILGNEIAHFLHGEQIATAAAQNPTMHPPPPQHWNPNHNGPPPGHFLHQQQQQQQQWQQQQQHPHHPQWDPRFGGPPPPVFGPPHPPHQWHPHFGHPHPTGYPPQESLPPPTQYHPNVYSQTRRERLPSLSEDDWEETLNQMNNNNQRENSRDEENNNSVAQDEYNRHRAQQQQQYRAGPPPGRHYEQDPRYDPRMMPPQQQHQQQGGHHDRRHSRGRSSSDQRGVNEQSSLLPAGAHTYEQHQDNRNMYGYGGMDNNGWPGQQQSHYHHHGNGVSGPSGSRGDAKKKKSKRRRREKEKRRQMFSSDTSDEETNSNSRSTSRQSHSKSKRSRGRRNRRRTDRSSLISTINDSASETYSESFISTGHSSVENRSKAGKDDRETNLNFFQQLLISTKLLVCNLPLSFAAISFSIVCLGIVWHKWTEEVLTSCKEVNFHSSQCAYHEFPGCYFCDEYNRWYILATKFKEVCSYIAGISVMLYFAKAILCWKVFIDEMSSPTTASPSGLIFMTMALSFVGKGDVGAILVFVASLFHLVLVVWFIYMSLAYQTMPDPSWFANTIGIGLCAVKVWFYEPLAGHFLIAITLMLTFLYYPISLIRVALNEKMSATICWVNMMGPAVSLYSLAIIMEPTFQQERPDINHFQTVQRSIYLPSMTCLFGLCVIGMISSVHGLIVRLKQIAREEFSPAHAAYSFPLLMHAMAVQSYRSSLDFFAGPEDVSPTFKTALHIYWVVLVVAGTITAVTCIVTYLVFLPSWVDVDTRNEIEPRAPNETSICNNVTYGESLIQPYISPTILQANETGILIMAYDYQNSWSDLIRTRRIPAFGFEPMMGKRMFERERNALKMFMGGQGVIREGDEEGQEEGDDMLFEENEIEKVMGPI